MCIRDRMVYFRATDEFLGWATPAESGRADRDSRGASAGLGLHNDFDILSERRVPHPCRAATGWESLNTRLQKIRSFSRSFTTTLTTLLIVFFAELGLKLSLMPVQTSSPSGVAVA